MKQTGKQECADARVFPILLHHSRESSDGFQERLVSVKCSSMIDACVDIQAGRHCKHETRSGTPMGRHDDMLLECNNAVLLIAELDVGHRRIYTRTHHNVQSFGCIQVLNGREACTVGYVTLVLTSGRILMNGPVCQWRLIISAGALLIMMSVTRPCKAPKNIRDKTADDAGRATMHVPQHVNFLSQGTLYINEHIQKVKSFIVNWSSICYIFALCYSYLVNNRLLCLEKICIISQVGSFESRLCFDIFVYDEYNVRLQLGLHSGRKNTNRRLPFYRFCLKLQCRQNI